MELLRGALETIKTQRPALLISIYHSVEHYFDIKPFLEDFSNKHNLGYKFQIYKGVDFRSVLETCLYAEVPL